MKSEHTNHDKASASQSQFFPVTKLFRLLLLLLSSLVSIAASVGAAQAQGASKSLWVIPFDESKKDEMVLAQAMQGLSGKLGPKIWLETGGMSAAILSQLEREGWQLHRIPSVWMLPDEFWKSHSSYITYAPNDVSLNVATSLAGPYNALPVSQDLANQVNSKGLKLQFSAVGRKQLDILSSNRRMFSTSMAVDQALEKSAYLRDFAILNNAFVFTADKDQRLRATVASQLLPGSTFFGWGPDEYNWISTFSHYGCQGLASDFCVNLSAMSKLPVAIPAQRSRGNPAPAKPGERILAFVLSDGDNIQWLNGSMAFDKKFFANPHRGEFVMNWGLSPTLASLAPRTLKYFYENAHDTDYFFAAGTPGYRYLHDEPAPKGLIDARQSQPLLRASGLNIVTAFNTNDGRLDECAPLLSLPEVNGVVYFSFAPYNRLNGQTFWSNNKPAVAAKFMLWENLPHCDINSVAKAISAMPAAPQKDQNSYAIVLVHAWSFEKIGGPMEAVSQTIAHLPPNTRIVSLAEFFYLLKQNCSK